MKVVLFCGGQGLRLREASDALPKPMVPIGYRPILWHLMKYYAHYGHKEFIVCLGHKGDVIKDYFLRYDECVSNDFVLTRGARERRLLSSDLDDWSITFVDTGLHSNIGQRLLAVRPHLEGEEMFLANYSDNLTDAPLPRVIEQFEQSGRVASFLSVQPSQSFHVVETAPDGEVRGIVPVAQAGLAINGGFFTFRRELWDSIREGEELVHEPFQRLIRQRKLATYRHDGFWACMDTFKEKQLLEELHSRGPAPWEVWKKEPPRARPAAQVTPMPASVLPRPSGQLGAA
jgi:glucose-1-phosphate cytidylyltransferase